MVSSYNKGILKAHTLFFDMYIPILCMAYGLTLYMDSPVGEMEKFNKYWQI